jgi:hypothetical protein
MHGELLDGQQLTAAGDQAAADALTSLYCSA